jgi:CheY-like chemotaxis protein
VTDTILIADDDQVVVALLSAELRERGFVVATAADAMQVMMAAHRTPPAAILLDIMMPGGSGFEVLKRLRSNSALSGVPVVAMSANTDPGLPQKVQALGAEVFLLKPVQPDEVAATLSRVLGTPGPQPNRRWRRTMSSDPESRDDAPSAPRPAPAPQGQAQVPSSAARVWAQFRDLIFERMAAVEAAAVGVRLATLTPEVRQKAVLEAHRLAGSLGMFGLADGTRLAREIEHLLDETAVLAPDTPRRLTELAAGLRQELEKGPV